MGEGVVSPWKDMYETDFRILPEESEREREQRQYDKNNVEGPLHHSEKPAQDDLKDFTDAEFLPKKKKKTVTP